MKILLMCANLPRVWQHLSRNGEIIDHSQEIVLENRYYLVKQPPLFLKTKGNPI